MGLFLGLDIGVSSVGYGIVNEDGQPIDAGVRLFSEGSKKDNETRRLHRHMRRGLRRKHHRLEQADRLFIRAGLTNYLSGTKSLDLQCDTGVTPYHLRAKGLREQLTDKELVIALRHILKRRGSQPLNAIDEMAEQSANGDSLSTKAIIAQTRAELDAGKFICEIQLARLLSSSHIVRGVENRFLTSDYANEAKQILQTQMAVNPKIDQAFTDAYLGLLEARRQYFEGPGSESPYAWASQEEWMEHLMGQCVYTGEPRIVKHAPSAEFFNLLNDLNNMLINGEHISFEEKVLLVDNVFTQQASSPSVSTVLKHLGRPKSSVVTGLRTNKAGTQIFTTLPGYRYLYKVNEESGRCIDMKDYALLDEVARILTVYQTAIDAISPLAVLGLPEEFFSRLVAIYDDPVACGIFKGTHSLSRSAIVMIWDDLWNTSKNQMELFTEKRIIPQHGKHCVKNGRIVPEIVNTLAVSAVVRRAISQAFTVFNDLLDKYPGGFERVTVEMAREKNSDEKKKWLTKLQKDNEALNNNVRDILEGKQGHRLFEKVRLWCLQNGVDLYTGESIPIDNLIAHPYCYEIDHIIPLSISFDDTQANKVLTSDKNNQDKGQRTPYQWMSDPDGPDFDAFAARVRSMKDRQQMPDKKRNTLLFKDDITKWEVRQKFINRNLVDTRYACKEVVFILKACLQDTDTVVQTVNGSFTHYLRKSFNLQKDRDVDFSHHALDALIVAASSLIQQSLRVFQQFELIAFDESNVVFDKQTGEVISSPDKELEAIIDRFKRYGQEFANFGSVKYSHKIDKKKNRQLCNETLYSTRFVETDTGRKEYLTAKLSDLYANPASSAARTQLLKTLRRLFVETPEACLMYESDRVSYDKLKAVYDSFIGDGKKNPFALYKEQFGYVTKNSKCGNGPAIKSLRYYDGEVKGNPLDLSHKQNCKGNKRVIMDGLSTYRVDIYKSAKKGFKVLRVSMSMAGGSEAGLKQLALEKDKQGVVPEDVFLFSLYKNDLFELDGKLYRFVGYKGGNCVEVAMLDKILCDENGNRIRITPYIGPSTSSIRKLFTNSLGLKM